MKYIRLPFQVLRSFLSNFYSLFIDEPWFEDDSYRGPQ